MQLIILVKVPWGCPLGFTEGTTSRLVLKGIAPRPSGHALDSSRSWRPRHVWKIRVPNILHRHSRWNLHVCSAAKDWWAKVHFTIWPLDIESQLLSFRWTYIKVGPGRSRPVIECRKLIERVCLSALYILLVIVLLFFFCSINYKLWWNISAPRISFANKKERNNIHCIAFAFRLRETLLTSMKLLFIIRLLVLVLLLLIFTVLE